MSGQFPRGRHDSEPAQRILHLGVVSSDRHRLLKGWCGVTHFFASLFRTHIACGSSGGWVSFYQLRSNCSCSAVPPPPAFRLDRWRLPDCRLRAWPTCPFDAYPENDFAFHDHRNHGFSSKFDEIGGNQLGVPIQLPCYGAP